MLGVREPEIYGRDTLDDIEARCRTHARALGLELAFRQSNHEGELATWIHEAREGADAVIINAAALTHTSLVLRDALALCDKPVIEVHLSNVFRREAFRHHSHISPVAHGVICGFGGDSYILALDAAARLVAPSA